MNNSVAVVGDLAVDYFEEDIRHSPAVPDLVPNWAAVPGYAVHRLGGGALLLADMIAYTLGDKAAVHGPDQSKLNDSAHRARLIRSLADLQFVRTEIAPPPNAEPAKEKQALTVHRVHRFRGFAGARDRNPEEVCKAFYASEPPAVRTLVVDDAGNGLRENSRFWPAWLNEGRIKPEIVLVKLSWPLPGNQPNELWRHLSQTFSEAKRVVVLNAEDLRRENVDLSCQLSWDRTTRDLARWAIDHPALKALTLFGHTIVRFGIEGAALVDPDQFRHRFVRLVCDPSAIEDDLRQKDLTYVPGGTSAFCAAFIADLLRREPEATLSPQALIEATCSGLASASNLVGEGYRKRSGDGEGEGQLYYPYDKIFVRNPAAGPRFVDGESWPKGARRAVFTVPLGVSEAVKPLRNAGDDPHRYELELAADLVETGLDRLYDIPHARFGEVSVADHREIESFRSVANLIRRYLREGGRDKPLSIAVFGPPGSGKSLGIKQIAMTLGKETYAGRIEKLEFNVAQWREPRDLSSAFHVARDIRLSGALPMIFFDEFDSALDGDKLGWLKSFLAPMQDGVFKDGERDHHVGRALLVFAGGTAHSYRQFQAQGAGDDAEGEQGAYSALFRDAKGPDFISRLRGYVDVKGPNPTPPVCEDHGYLLRRALILRHNLIKLYPGLRRENGSLSLDKSIVRAFLTVSHYKHGARSMDSILHMSSLSSISTHFSQSLLPSDEQLALHVDVASFRKCLQPS